MLLFFALVIGCGIRLFQRNATNPRTANSLTHQTRYTCIGSPFLHSTRTFLSWASPNSPVHFTLPSNCRLVGQPRSLQEGSICRPPRRCQNGSVNQRSDAFGRYRNIFLAFFSLSLFIRPSLFLIRCSLQILIELFLTNVQSSGSIQTVTRCRYTFYHIAIL